MRSAALAPAGVLCLALAACGGSARPADVPPADAIARAAAASSAGQFEAARTAAAQVADAGGAAAAAVPALGRLQEFWVLLRFGRWADAAEVPKPSSATLLENTLWEYGQAAAAAGRMEMGEALRHQRLFLVGAAAVGTDVQASASNGARAVLAVAQADLLARLDWARGDVPKAMLEWSRAVAAEDALAPADPPDWPLPVRERLGAAILSLGNGPQAEGVFRAELERRPDSPRALYGLSESLVLQGRSDEAAAARREFEALWHGDGSPLPLPPGPRAPARPPSK